MSLATVCGAQPTTAPSAGAPSHGGDPLSGQSAVYVKSFRFVGNTRFSGAKLAEAIKTFAGRRLTTERLEEARLVLTRLYVDAGYINSGAVLPDQVVSDGIITFRIVEGRLSDVDVTFKDGNGKSKDRHLLRSDYVADRIRFAANPPPMDLLRVKDELELLRQDPNIARINAELKPGTSAGDSRLDVQVTENNPFQLGLQWSNRRNPSVGSTAYDVLAYDRDLTGNGDLLNVQYDVANGPVNDPRLDGADDFSLNYAIPFTPADTSLAVNFTKTNALVTQTPFTDLNIRSRTTSTSLTLRQPIYRRPVAEAAGPGKPGSPSVQFDLFTAAAIRENSTSLLNRPFSFSPGENNGAGRVTVVRFGQELVMRSQNDALSARSIFSLGVPWFGSTPDFPGQGGGRFFAWLAQAQYVHLIDKTDWQLVLRAAGQLSDRPLLPVEQFSLGGIDSIRGYPENDLVRDQGINGSVELHIPLIHGNSGAGEVLTLVPFFDAGYGWNRVRHAAPSQALDSVGVGLLFAPSSHVSAQLFYGAALQNHSHGSHDPEDLGIHFNVLFLAY